MLLRARVHLPLRHQLDIRCHRRFEIVRSAVQRPIHQFMVFPRGGRVGRARHLRVVRHLNLHPRLPIAKEPTIRQENHFAHRHARIRHVLRLQHQIVNHLRVEAIRVALPKPPNELETALRGVVRRLRCLSTMHYLLLCRLGRTPVR